MNHKTYALFAMSLTAILSLSILGTTPQAVADNNNEKWIKNHPLGKPDFVSADCLVTIFATSNLSPEALSTLDCTMEAWLNKKADTLNYRIEITGMQLIDTDNNIQDDVTQLHIHKYTTGTIENPKGPHQLNVFRAPNFDDSDVVIQPVQGIMTGIWDDGDENLSYGEPDNSHKLTENLQSLCDGKVFSAAHGNAEDMPGHKAPYLKMLLEPTKNGEKICKKLGF